MRIISGTLKGKAVNPPKGYPARPTTDFAKEGLFNMLDCEYEFDGLSVLDLFAGTGSIGFEFISRGAGLVDAVEMNPSNVRFIRGAAAGLSLRNYTVIHHNVFDFFKICTRRYDIVFADPPYALEGLADLPDKVLSSGILYDGAYFILEHGADNSFKEHPLFVKEKKYGNVHFSFFRPAE